MKVLAAILASCAVLGLCSCGSDSSTSAADDSTQEQTSARSESLSSADGPEADSDEAGSVESPPASKPPSVSVPPGPPPKQLVVKDLRKGTGAVLRAGKDLSARYIAVDYRTGKVLERVWQKPFEWSFGPGQVVQAWVEGLGGMRVGGLRELIAPSRLAYDKGAEIWVVELLSVS